MLLRMRACGKWHIMQCTCARSVSPPCCSSATVSLILESTTLQKCLTVPNNAPAHHADRNRCQFPIHIYIAPIYFHGAVGPAGALLAEAEDAALDGITARLGRLLPAAGPCSAAPVRGRAVVRVPHPLMAHTPSGGLQPAKSRSVALWSGFGQAFEIGG